MIVFCSPQSSSFIGTLLLFLFSFIFFFSSSSFADDIPANTFDEIPTNVFDAIPAAVNERESRRLKRLQEEAQRAKEEREKEKERSARAKAIYQEQQLMQQQQQRRRQEEKPQQEQVIMQPSMAGQQQEEAPSDSRDKPAEDREKGEVENANGNNVSLITALFPHAVGVDRREQVEGDFMFAVFIQEKEQRTATMGTGETPGAPNPRWGREGRREGEG